MNLTLHLTKDCNMDCSYCLDNKCCASMTEETADAACRLAFSKGSRVGLCFFGGEPLLKRELILRCIDNCCKLSEETGKKADLRMTTNGTLLDEEIIFRFKKENAVIGVSFDGKAQDICRRYRDGKSTFGVLEEKSRLLLRYMPDSYALMTVAPEAAGLYAESVRYLYGLGFRRITATIAYGSKVRWTDSTLDVLRGQLRETAAFFRSVFSSEEHFYFSPFSSKIRECISGYNPAERCHLGKKQFSVDTEGNIYPCTQFMNDPNYLIGTVSGGIYNSRLAEIAACSVSPCECAECDLRMRCTNSCGCMNRIETGNENKVSPLQCTYERMLISEADQLAETLLNDNKDKFIKEFS